MICIVGIIYTILYAIHNSQFSTFNSQFSTLNLNDSLVVVYNLSVKQIDNSIRHHSVVL